MSINIISEKKNVLLKRKEITFEIEHEKKSTPTRYEIRKKIAAQLNAPLENTYIKSLKSKFGLPRTIGVARIYESEERAKLLEPKHIIKRNKEKKQKKEED
ncbi:MAG: 30S ribosomal protein S24e [Candidatus Helarchaeota archaeon]